MPRTKEQNKAIRAEKRQIIIDAALALFAEDGYAHTSIDKIAKHAKISKGLLYTYFESKDDLLMQILMSGYKKIAYDLFKEDMTAEDYLNNIEQVFDHMMEYKDFFRLYTAISVQPSVSRKLAALTDQQNTGAIANFYRRQFGENAPKEMLLMAIVIKGFSVFYLFGDGQSVYPLDLLRETVLEFLRKQLKINS